MLRNLRIWYSLLTVSTLIVLGHALYPHIHHGSHIHSPLAEQDGWLRMLYELFGADPGRHHLEVCVEDERQDHAAKRVCLQPSAWSGHRRCRPVGELVFEDHSAGILRRRTLRCLPLRAPPYAA
jgi:hypothetical protein